MPSQPTDRDNAGVLAKICAVIILAMLYGLGGISLFLRAQFLKPTATPVAATPVAVTVAPTQTPLPPAVTVVPSATPTLTPTLYPTLTPRAPSGQGQ
jgi:hypothetical protein